MSHSPIGPGQSQRILNCPGFVGLSAQCPPSPTSKYAEEGKLAHTVAESYLQGKELPLNTTDEMPVGAKMYAAAIDVICSFPTLEEMNIEQKLHCPEIHKDYKGTSDLFIIKDKWLYVFDYKFGKGIKKYAKNNSQLLYYADLALLKLMGDNSRFLPSHLQGIKLVIVQPRLNHIDVWECHWSEPLTFRNKFLTKLLISDVFAITDECQFCPAKAICPAQIQAVKDKFVDITVPVVTPKIPDVSPEQLKIYMDNANQLESWIFAIRKHAFSYICQGHILPGYKLGESQGNRKWINEADTKKHLNSLYPSDLIYDIVLKSPAQLDKLISKKDVALLCERSINKKLMKTDEIQKESKDYFEITGE